MTKIKKNETFIPVKNYILAAVIVVVIIGLTWYAFAWYNVVQENKVSTSYLVQEKIISKEITDLNEVNNIFSEAPDSYFVYISYTGDEQVYNMEKSLKSVIKAYNLSDNMYYLNVTSIKDEKDYMDKVNKALGLTDRKVVKVPTILYFEEGKLVEMTDTKSDLLMTRSDFQKLIILSGIEK